MPNACFKTDRAPESGDAAGCADVYAPAMPGTPARIAIALLFAGALLYATFGMGGAECEVCLEFRGRNACATVTAQGREEAIQQAVSTACAGISAGVTDSMECSRTFPESVRCSE